ncbi:MAG: hypothetical protein ACREVO_03340 [Steroidobacteraceae bacterium]
MKAKSASRSTGASRNPRLAARVERAPLRAGEARAEGTEVGDLHAHLAPHAFEDSACDRTTVQSDRSYQPHFPAENLTDEAVGALRADQLLDDRLNFVDLTESLRCLARAVIGVPDIECGDFVAVPKRCK